MTDLISHAEMIAALRFAIQLAEAEGYSECAAGLRAVLAHLERTQPADAQADLTERARIAYEMLNTRVGGGVAWEEHEEIYRDAWRAAVSAALQSEREAAAANTESRVQKAYAVGKYAGAAEARRALENIAGGFIPKAATDALLAGDWHPAFTALQQIANAALASPPTPQEETR